MGVFTALYRADRAYYYYDNVILLFLLTQSLPIEYILQPQNLRHKLVIITG